MNGIIGDFLLDQFDKLGKLLWVGSLAVLRGALTLVGKLGQINPSPGAGPISAGLWSSMLGLAAIVAVLLFFVQLIMAVLNPRRQMLHAVTGPVQYAIATAVSVAIVLALLGAADGMSTLILSSTHQSEDIAGSLPALGLADAMVGVKGAVLGVMAVVGIIPLAIGYGITLLFRSAAIIVLIATLPITAAGLVSMSTKHWFHRAGRWLLALIFLKPTFALCFAIGAGVVKTAGQPPAGGAPGSTGIVTLVLGLGIMFVALFAPFALFRLFAFVEPGTQPHQTLMSAFGSAMAGFKQAGSGIASADVASVFSGATGGRFGSSGGGQGDGQSSGSSGGDERKQAAATAALAAATGGTSAAAGAAGGAAAGGEAGVGSAAESAGAGSSAGQSPIAATASRGTGSGAPGEQDSEQAPGELAGAGAATGAGVSQPAGASAGSAGAGGGAGSSASSSSGGSSSAGSSGGSSGSAAGGVSGGSAPAGSLAGAWGQATSAAAAVGSWGGGRVGAAGSAAGSVGRGALGAGAQIAGYTPMPPAPHGGVGGPTHDPAATDYGGATPPLQAANRYRDPSWDQPDDDGDDGGRDDEPDDGGYGRMSGVI